MYGPPAYLASSVNRLRGITGFVTVYPDGGDARTQAFARYFHVRRVARLSAYLAEQRGVDQLNCAEVAWSHDLNRWPFAFNTEKGNYDQPASLSNYLISAGASPDLARRAESVASKDLGSRDQIVSLVLLADIVAGFFEDTLLAITGLNLSPREIPEDVTVMLGLEFTSREFLAELKFLHSLLHVDRDVEAYVKKFDETFSRAAQSFVKSHGLLRPGSLRRSSFLDIRHQIRLTFLPQKLFPLSANMICSASNIRHLFLEPALRALGPSDRDVLTQWTERDATYAALEQGWLQNADIAKLVPDLDALSKKAPDQTFVLN